MTEWWESGDERADRLITLLAWLVIFGTWLRDRQVSERLADVEVPHGFQLPLLMFMLVGKRINSRQWAEAGKSMKDLAETLATRMVESDSRQQELLELEGSLERLARESSDREAQLVTLQASLESLASDSSGREATLVALQQSVTRYTRWLLVLTVVVALTSIGSIATAVVIAATQ